MNWQQVEDSWNRVHVQFHTRWWKLTDADLRQIRGKREDLVRRLQELYSLDERRAEDEAELFIRTLR